MNLDPGFWKELSKFVATGLLAFGASSLYTGWRMSPEHNITLVPLSAVLPEPKNPSDEYCHVDINKLNAILSSESTKGVPGLIDYLAFLRRTSELQTVNVDSSTAKKFSQLRDQNVFVRCGRGMDYHGIPDTIFNVGFLMGQEATYLLNKECSIRMQTTIIPARIRTSSPSNPYPVEKTSLLEVGYDELTDKKEDKEAIEMLQKKLSLGSNDPTSIAVTCTAAQPAPWWSFGSASARKVGGKKDYLIKVIQPK